MVSKQSTRSAEAHMDSGSFIPRHIGPSDAEQREMLQALGFEQGLGRRTRSRTDSPASCTPPRHNFGRTGNTSVHSRERICAYEQTGGVAITLASDADVNGAVSRESARWLQPEGASKEHIVAERWMCVEREMRGVHRNVVCQEQSQAMVHTAGDPLDSSPHHPVMNEQQVRPAANSRIDDTP